MKKGKIRSNIKMLRIVTREALMKAEREYRNTNEMSEYLPWAQGTSYVEIAEEVRKDQSGDWETPLYLTETMHSTVLGVRNICRMANDYLERLRMSLPLDILSISAYIRGGRIALTVLVRPYRDDYNFIGFFSYVGDKPVETMEIDDSPTSGRLVIPDEIKNFKYTEEEIEEHDRKYNKQSQLFNASDSSHPFLNSIAEYIPERMPTPEDKMDLIYDLKTLDMRTQTIMPYPQFNKIFQEIMTYVNGVEFYQYVTVMKGDKKEEDFMNFLKDYIQKTYIDTGRFSEEDLDAMMNKLHRSLFQFYVVQDLIDDPNVTDIKITGPDSIRARVKGKAYITNISFIDVVDYCRFVNAIAIRNKISQKVPEQTFTDNSDPNYIIRFSLTAAYANSVDWPYLHIRKIDRKKPLGDDLIKAGMFNEKIRDYILDCGKNSRGVVFAGPPGSGKTVCLNWFLEEAYEQSAEILVIQENDELFAYRKGVMFQHVVNYSINDEEPVTLEDLGKLALVAGANVFIIGEAKGAEICSAITLSNSGCRTAITIHTPSSTETLDKMADLAMRGYAKDYYQALRMLKSFQTIVYLDKFKVKEISEITGYDEETHQVQYKYIYRADMPDAQNMM